MRDTSPSQDSRLPRRFKAGAVRLCQVLSALALLAPAAMGGEYDRLASELAKAARASGVKRVAVLPFQGLEAKDAGGGRLVAERLVAPLSQEKGLVVVERTLLDSVLSEQRLQSSGLVDMRTLRELGRLLDADAVVAGAVASLRGDRAEIDARLIESESGRVLGAVTARVEKDWPEGSLLDQAGGWGPALPPLPSFEAPLLASWDARDAVAEQSCRDARERVDREESRLVELKARYWAQRLRGGLEPGRLKRNPGSEIKDAELRARFYALLRRESAAPGPALRSDELERLKDGLARIERLSSACGTEGTWN